MKYLVIFFSFIVYGSIAQNFDLNTVQKINAYRYKKADKALDILSSSADYTALASPIITLSTGFIKNDTELKQKGLNMAIGVVGTYGIGYILKTTVNRKRPYEIDPKIKGYRIENDSSFPSGSTALAFTNATNLTLAFPKWYVAVPAYAYATGIGYARMHLGAHFPTDVLAGAAIGTASAFISKSLNNALRNKVRKRKVKRSQYDE
jgi:membrane-associated phospholipid phosphatase